MGGGRTEREEVDQVASELPSLGELGKGLQRELQESVVRVLNGVTVKNLVDDNAHSARTLVRVTCMGRGVQLTSSSPSSFRQGYVGGL